MRQPGPVAWRTVIAVCVIAGGVAATPSGRAAPVAMLAGLAVLAAGLVAAARSLGPGRRRVWTPWIAAVGCAVAGAAIFQTGVLLDVVPVAADVAQFFWLFFYLPVTVATMRFIERRGLPRAVRRAVLQDVAVVTAAATVLAWYALIRPALAATPPGNRWALIAAFSFPLGDVVILALGLTLVLAPGALSAAERLALLGFGLTLVLDVVYAVLPMVAAGLDAFWHHPGYLVVNAVLTAAALHPSRDAVSPAVPRTTLAVSMTGWRMILLGAALSGVSLSVFVMPRDGWDAVPAALALLVMIALILARLRRSVTALERTERALRHEVTHDQLTGIANRARLMDDLRGALRTRSALFFIDLDGFKAINDQRGHHSGDLVLQTVAARLSTSVRESDTVARLGGDEFVVLCPGLEDETTSSLAARIERSIAEPIAVDGGAVTIGASIGILMLSAPATAADGSIDQVISDLLRSADAAMYAAKRDGGGVRVVTYG
ncbi:GGDEF domain-containing protein [Actinoplanes sp. NPDC089786]|uniref:GGDEF domain-containing protein n=1 Tax=Actinoplanes sp. NPDC089786 TaxID=3155185 RepID=UPI0034453143